MDFSPKMWGEILPTISYHYKAGNVNWPMGIYVSLVHAVALAGIFALPNCSKETLIWAFVLWPIRYVTVIQDHYVILSTLSRSHTCRLFLTPSLDLPSSLSFSGFGITVGVHRLWSHRSYEASFIVRFFLYQSGGVPHFPTLDLGERGAKRNSMGQGRLHSDCD